MTSIDQLEPKQFFSSLSGFDSLFRPRRPLWEALSNIRSYLDSLSLDEMGNHIHPTAHVHPTARVSNSYVDRGVEIHEFVIVRDSLVGPETVIGHCSEIARSIIMSRCMISRFDYLGSSIVGNVVEFGGVCSLATERFDNESVVIRDRDVAVDTQLLKFGSIIGDGSMLGFAVHCHPGTIVGRKCIIMPKVEVRGILPDESVVSAQQRLIITKRRSIHRLGLPNLRTRKYMERL